MTIVIIFVIIITVNIVIIIIKRPVGWIRPPGQIPPMVWLQSRRPQSSAQPLMENLVKQFRNVKRKDKNHNAPNHQNNLWGFFCLLSLLLFFYYDHKQNRVCIIIIVTFLSSAKTFKVESENSMFDHLIIIIDNNNKS